MAKILIYVLTSLSIIAIFQGNSAFSGGIDPGKEKVEPVLYGFWNECDNPCGSNQFAFCVMSDRYINSQCSYSKIIAPSGFGGPCNLGSQKPFCSPINKYPNVINYQGLKGSGAVWRGSAPACDPDCGDGYFALCRSKDGKKCDFSSSVDISQLPGSFGHECVTGRKVYCVPLGVMFGSP